MKKIRDLVFRLIPFALLILLFVTILLCALIFLMEWLYIVVITLYVLNFIMLLAILNKKQAPDFKLPWVVVICLLPIFGMLIYVIFGKFRTRKKYREYHARMRAGIAECMTEPEGEKEAITEYKDVYNYLSSVTTLNRSGGNKMSYYKSGEEYFAEAIKEMKTAKEFIYIEFFIIGLGKLWSDIYAVLKEKVKEGVDIRIIYDDLGSVGRLNLFFARKLRKEGIKCYRFNPILPVLSGIFNNRDHRKIIVVDRKCAFTGGMNVGDEYVNIDSPFGYWKDSGIKIEGPAIKNLTSLFLETYDICSGVISDYKSILCGEYKAYDVTGCVLPFGDGPAPFYKELIGENSYINLINSAKETLFISTPYLIPTHSLINALRNAAFRGVRVVVIVPKIPDKKSAYSFTKNNFKYLADAGVEIYLYTPGFNHQKVAVADGKVAFVGTINLDYRSLVHHFECGAVLSETDCIKDINNDLLEMISVSERVVNPKYKHSLIYSLLNIFAPLF